MKRKMKTLTAISGLSLSCLIVFAALTVFAQTDTTTTPAPIAIGRQEVAAEELTGDLSALQGWTGGAPHTTLEVINEGSFLCKNGATLSCKINGKPGIRECFNGRFTPCVPIDDEPTGPVVSGTVQPKYYILSVIYAPPGTKGGDISSSVKYGSGSTTGTTVSSSSSFKNNHSVTVSTGVNIFEVVKIGGELSYEYTRNKSSNRSLDIRKSASKEINMPGPSVDGIDHDRDQIWLWLNPTVKLTLTPTSASWALDSKREAVIQFVFAGHLKDPSKMPPGVVQALRSHGITAEDFPEILKADPFVRRRRLVEATEPEPIVIDTKRFKRLPTTFPYEPPFAQGDKATTLTFSITNATAGSSASSVERETTLGANSSGSAGFLSFFEASIKNENKWTWTNSTTNSTSADATESAAVTVGGPAFGYTGPTNMRVYYDVLYKTFLFVPIEPEIQPVLQGRVMSSSGKAVGGKEVIVVANGVKHRTFTNAKGEYRIFERISGPLRLQVDAVRKQLSPLQPGKKADIVLP